jgi:hypothetical protein
MQPMQPMHHKRTPRAVPTCCARALPALAAIARRPATVIAAIVPRMKTRAITETIANSARVTAEAAMNGSRRACNPRAGTVAGARIWV